MSGSFEEKSVWIHLVSILFGLGAYLLVAWRMLSSGIMALPAYVPLFAGAVV